MSRISTLFCSNVNTIIISNNFSSQVCNFSYRSSRIIIRMCKEMGQQWASRTCSVYQFVKVKKYHHSKIPHSRLWIEITFKYNTSDQTSNWTVTWLGRKCRRLGTPRLIGRLESRRKLVSLKKWLLQYWARRPSKKNKTLHKKRQGAPVCISNFEHRSTMLNNWLEFCLVAPFF